MSKQNIKAEIFGNFDVTAVKTDGDVIKVSGYANTTNKDRAADVILESAWKTKEALGNYTKNPIILAQHDHNRPIGKMLNHKVDQKGLFIEAEIYNNGDSAFQNVKNGILKTFSVGFRVVDASYNKMKDAFEIKNLELLEVSVVSVPCNADSTFDLSKSYFQKAVSGSPDTVISVREAVRSTSSVLNSLVTLEANAENQLVAYNMADGSETLGGKTVPVVTDSVTRFLTNETIEDAAFDIQALFDANLINAAAIKLENQFSQRLVDRAAPSTSSQSAKNFDTVKDMYQRLDRVVRQTAGTVYVFANFDTICDITGSTSYFEAADIIKERFTFVVAEEMESAELVLAHEFGLFGRLRMDRGVETENFPSQDRTDHILGYRWGLEVDQAFVVKKINLS